MSERDSRKPSDPEARSTEPHGDGAGHFLVDRLGDAGTQQYLQRRRVQKRARATASPADVQTAAAAGTRGAGGQLPHFDTIQRSFGHHDVSAIQAHTDDAAAAGATAMGAEAFASGDHVAFADAPSLHVAAHEAAHVVQQRGGVQLKGGVGQAGDSYEQHAEDVAALVVQGKSAEALLDRHAAPGKGGGGATQGDVQRFYVESDDDPGYQWLDNSQWDASQYELSDRQPGWLAYKLYRPKSKKSPPPSLSEKDWQRRKIALREVLSAMERDRAKFDEAAARKKVDEAISRALSGLTGDERSARVEELRHYIDTLPDYFGDHVINVAHAAINPQGPQIGIPGVTYLGPSKTPDDKHVINRGVSDAVLIEKTWYVPIYMTVFGDALGDSTPKHKDSGQDGKGRVEIHSGKTNPGSDNTLWVSIGRPLRQIKWLEKYAAKGAPEPLVRSFLLPLDVANAISKDSITEHESSGLGKDLNVDKHYERNQYGIVDQASFEKLRQFALPGSMRTYTDGATQNRPQSWGEVRPASELRERIGAPGKRIPGFDVYVDHTAQEFTSKSKYQEQVNTLIRVYAYHTGNTHFLPKGESMPDATARKNAVHKFFTDHKPGDLQDDDEGLMTFVSDYVAPWATQAQISQEIAEDFDDLTGKERGELPTEAPSIQPGGKQEKPLRGQRRPEATKMSAELRELLGKRQALLDGLSAASGKMDAAFKDSTVTSVQKRPLGELRKSIEEIRKDYDFYVGREERVTKQLPIYKQTIAGRERDVRSAPLHALLTEVADELAKALAAS